MEQTNDGSMGKVEDNMTITHTASEQETFEVAKKLAEQLQIGSFLALSGDLGVGKTAFTKGIAAGLGIADPVVSPTFTLLRVYESGRLPLYHYDVYRIGSPDELEEIDFYEFAYGNGVCVCEWAELIAEELPPNRLDITITRTGENDREIHMEAVVHDSIGS